MKGLLPSDFPTQTWTQIVNRLRPFVDGSALVGDVLGAYNAVAYRFLTMAESDECFTDLIGKTGAAPEQPDRYKQERELFVFFSAGYSVIESAVYLAYSIGGLVDSTTFPLTNEVDRRSVDLRTTLRLYRSKFPNSSLLTELEALASDHEHDEWRNVRNILLHRVHPGRTFGGVPKWRAEGITIDQTTTSSRRAWLARRLTAILEGIHEFCRAELS